MTEREGGGVGVCDEWMEIEVKTMRAEGWKRVGKGMIECLRI